MRRFTLRVRLTLAFALAMAVVIAGIGLFVDFRVEHSLRMAVDQGLRARALDVTSLASQADNGLSQAAGPLSTPGNSFGQLINAQGRVFDMTPGLRRRPLLNRSQLDRAGRGAYFTELNFVAAAPARVFVTSIRAQDQRLVLLVGTSLTAERSALQGLRTGLLIGGPIALLLASLGGYLLAGAALHPVERMRARAAGLSAVSPGGRLPVPKSDDEISRLGRTLNGLLGRVEQAREREQRFLADASHELRTPLTLLKVELELALQSPRSIAALESALRSASEETDRLVQLAEDLLLLAQVDQGNLPVRLAPMSVGELAQRVALRFAVRAARAGREIAVEVPGEIVIRADAARLDQAVGNLIDNSLRYGTGTVTVEGLISGEGIELHVRDEGPGIPVLFRTHAFERFTRADGARTGRGTGLGLAIVGAVAAAHQGEAVIGDGADVCLQFPPQALVAAWERSGIKP